MLYIDRKAYNAIIAGVITVLFLAFISVVVVICLIYVARRIAGNNRQEDPEIARNDEFSEGDKAHDERENDEWVNEGREVEADRQSLIRKSHANNSKEGRKKQTADKLYKNSDKKRDKVKREESYEERKKRFLEFWEHRLQVKKTDLEVIKRVTTNRSITTSYEKFISSMESELWRVRDGCEEEEMPRIEGRLLLYLDEITKLMAELEGQTREYKKKKKTDQSSKETAVEQNVGTEEEKTYALIAKLLSAFDKEEKETLPQLVQHAQEYKVMTSKYKVVGVEDIIRKKEELSDLFEKLYVFSLFVKDNGGNDEGGEKDQGFTHIATEAAEHEACPRSEDRPNKYRTPKKRDAKKERIKNIMLDVESKYQNICEILGRMGNLGFETYMSKKYGGLKLCDEMFDLGYTENAEDFIEENLEDYRKYVWEYVTSRQDCVDCDALTNICVEKMDKEPKPFFMCTYKEFSKCIRERHVAHTVEHITANVTPSLCEIAALLPEYAKNAHISRGDINEIDVRKRRCIASIQRIHNVVKVPNFELIVLEMELRELNTCANYMRILSTEEIPQRMNAAEARLSLMKRTVRDEGVVSASRELAERTKYGAEGTGKPEKKSHTKESTGGAEDTESREIAEHIRNCMYVAGFREHLDMEALSEFDRVLSSCDQCIKSKEQENVDFIVGFAVDNVECFSRAIGTWLGSMYLVSFASRIDEQDEQSRGVGIVEEEELSRFRNYRRHGLKEQKMSLKAILAFGKDFKKYIMDEKINKEFCNTEIFERALQNLEGMYEECSTTIGCYSDRLKARYEDKFEKKKKNCRLLLNKILEYGNAKIMTWKIREFLISFEDIVELLDEMKEKITRDPRKEQKGCTKMPEVVVGSFPPAYDVTELQPCKVKTVSAAKPEEMKPIVGDDTKRELSGVGESVCTSEVGDDTKTKLDDNHSRKTESFKANFERGRGEGTR